ncbi:nuclear pore complex protein Nup107 [Centruroides vittatus]|uniref:nuclear pore complex protein Nup107 n=1 Tax=Centruroides vittatus TaxID=120091 RepID=UPI00350F7891
MSDRASYSGRMNVDSGSSRLFGNLSESPIYEDSYHLPSRNIFHSRNKSKLESSFLDGSGDTERSEKGEKSFNVTVDGNRTIDLLDEMGDITRFSVDSCALSEEPGLQATLSLFKEFLDAFRSRPAMHEIFQLLLDYESLCSNHVNFLKKMTMKLPYNKFHRAMSILEMLRDERNTWKLLRTLYQDRLEVEEMLRNEEVMMDTLYKRMSDKQVIEYLYERDSTVRQNQLIVDWLEKNAAEDFEHNHPNKVEFFLQHNNAWENTYHALMNPKVDHVSSEQHSLINELDPDAPVRLNDRKLHDTDKRNESRLLKYMFAYLRSGQLLKAENLAERFGQPWLAAALEGWKLCHDANFDKNVSEGDVLCDIEGNPYRDVWKAMCWKISEDVRIPEYERAMYAALSGNLKVLLPVCASWEDYLWAYMKVALDVRIEQEIRRSTQQERALEQLPSTYWDKTLTNEQIFQELQASVSNITQMKSTNYYHVMQKYIILDNVEALVEEMYKWSQMQPRPSSHLLRFMSHVILFLRTIGRSCKEELTVAILESYVKDLIEKQQVMLIADYTATLPTPQQILWYAKFLEGISGTKERQLCLKLAESVGLDVALITKTLVENIRSKEGEDDTTSILSSETTKEDLLKIEAIDWLVFDPAQRSEAIRQANALMRVFIANKKLDAARKVFSKIPSDSIDIIIRQWKRITGTTELPPEDDNATREYFCFQAYLQAHDAFNDWFEHYHQARPKEPIRPENTRFTEWIAFEHRMKQYEADLERWEQSLRAQTESTTDRIYNVLLFIDGGWMVDQRTEGVIDEARQKQMALLRKLCIPQMTFLLHTVLHSTSQFEECLQIADIITSEKNQLYKEFNLQELENLQRKLCESSLKLLDMGVDPIGYPYQ